ncbi:MAG: hypothetical protein ACTTH7_05555 [Treponema sp.]
MKQISTPFIKVTEPASISLTSEQKARLNRQGNVYFNEGRINEAKRIFIATGYSDGLTRIGDYYADKNQMIEALRFYHLAKNKRKSQPIIDLLIKTVKILLDTDTKGVENVRKS